jgi:hypothetical protein
MFGEEPAMRLPAQLQQNKLWNIGVILFLVVAMSFLVYFRYPFWVTDEEEAVYAAVNAVDTMIDEKQFGRVIWAENRTKAWVQVAYAVCGPSHDYILRYELSKDSSGWHAGRYPELVQEVFC